MPKKKPTGKDPASKGKSTISNTTHPNKNTMTVADMAERIMQREREIKGCHPRISKQVSTLIDEIRQRLAKLKFAIEKLPSSDAALIKILAIGRLEKLMEDILSAKK